MSSFADINYYNNVYKGAKIGNDPETLLERASDIVRQSCINLPDDIEKLPDIMQENIRKAVCAQAEFMEMNGGAEAFANENFSAGTGFSIGNFSVSKGSSGSSGENISGKISARNSPAMISYLEAAGLLYRGGNIL